MSISNSIGNTIEGIVGHLGPIIAPTITAAAAWYLGSGKQRNQDRALENRIAQTELDWLERSRKEAAEIVERRISEVVSERDKLRGEVGKLQERVAVLEFHYRELEKSKQVAISKLNKVIDELREENEMLQIHKEQLQTEVTDLRLILGEKTKALAAALGKQY